MIWASKMDRYASCPGAYQLEKLAPKRPSGESAALGIAAAKLAETCLKNGTDPLQYIGGDVDIEMVGHINLYLDYCRKHIPSSGAQIEHKMISDELHLAGTPDFMSFDGDTILIADLKYGFGWVEAVENWQLMSYVALWAGVTGYRFTPKTIKLVIVQPRANHPQGPIREWTINGQELRAICNRVANVTSAALTPQPVCYAGAHCRYCPAIIGCDTNKRAVTQCMDAAYQASYTEMDASTLSHELITLQQCQAMINHRVTAVEEYAAAQMADGNIIPGYSYDSTPGPMRWISADPVAQAAAMSFNISAPVEPITPKQAIDRGIMPENLVKMLTKREQGAPKLKKVPMSKFKQLIKSAGKAEI